MIRVEDTDAPKPIGGMVRYDAACRALAEAKSVDEVKDLRDKAEAMRAYAKQAKNKQLEVDAAEIRIRAERRLGEMINGQKATVGLNEGGRPAKTGLQENPVSKPTPAAAGIDKNLADRARKMAAVPDDQFEAMVGEWRDRVAIENERVSTNLLKAGEKAQQERRENDFYPTPDSLIAEVLARWKPRSKFIWEPCVGDGRVADALRCAGYEVTTGDIADGDDFFDRKEPPRPGIVLFTNPPFGRLREFIDHAFAIGIREMCLVLPERVWASGVGREQFHRHRPSLWVNLDWREDYLGKGGSPDRALAVAIWDQPCAAACHYEVWSRGAGEEQPKVETHDAEACTPNSNAVDTASIVTDGRANLEHDDVDRSTERASSAAEVGATNSPDGATRTMRMTPIQPREANGLKGFGFTVNFEDPETPADPQPKARQADSAGEETPPASPATQSKADMIRRLRPHCQHPGTDLCGGSGPNHCHACKKAMAEGEAA